MNSNHDTRGSWGTYSKTTDFSDISVPNNIRDSYFVISYDKIPKKYVSVDENKKEELSGSGFMDTLKRNLQKVGRKVGQASDFYSSEFGTTLKNLIPSSDDNARPAFAGEKHAILQLPNGKNGIANFMGPGTEVVKRLKRNDPGRTESDKVAKRHDIDYILAQGEKTKEAQLVKVREADNRMIKNLQKIRENKSDSNRNIQMGLRLIQAKVAGENVGVLDKSKFAGDIVNLSASDRILLEEERKKSEQGGYGIDGKLLPGQKLKMALLAQKVKGPRKPRTDPDIDTRLAGSGKRKGKGLSLAGGAKGKGLSLAGGAKGKGLSLAGGAFDIKSMLTNTIMPELMKQLKLNIPVAEIFKVVDKFIQNDKSTLSSDLLGLAKEFIPLATMYKMKQAKINPVELQKKGILTEAIKMAGNGKKGKGLKLAGQGMQGSGIFDNINKLLGPAKDIAVEALYNGLMEYVKSLILGKKGSGGIMTGGDFWSEFASGFKTGFVNTLNVLKVPVSILAPELAPAFAVGDVIGKVLPGKMLYTI